MSLSINLIISLLWGFTAAGLAWYCSIIARQITYVTLADGRKRERRLPILFRLLLPLAPNFTPLFKKQVFKAKRDKLEKKLISAGYEDLITPEELLSMHTLLPAVFGVVWVVIAVVLLFGNNNFVIVQIRWIMLFGGPILLFSYPSLWLRKTLMARHKEIRKSLPFVLDLLTLSVESGMDFMTALQKSVEKGRVDALGEELLRVVREIQIGKTRREALRDMSKRVNLQDLRSVVGALVQADELGVSIGSILRIQADQIRQRRFDRAEKLANEAPVKMLAPLLLFIFPAVFVILLGPILYRVLQQGF